VYVVVKTDLVAVFACCSCPL